MQSPGREARCNSGSAGAAMSASWLALALLALVCAFAGFVRGLSGFGGPMIAIPALQMVFAPKTSLFVALAADLVANIRLVPDALKHARWDELRPLLIGGLLGLPVGQTLVHIADPALARQTMLIVVVVSVGLLMVGWRWAKPLGPPGLGMTGIAGGVSLGLSGILLIVSVLLQADRGSPQQSRAQFVIFAFLATALAVPALVMTEFFAGRWDEAVRSVTPPAIVLIPSYVAGVAVGISRYGTLDEPALRRWTLRLAMSLAILGLMIA
jgi:uncharacterized protein